MLSTVPERQYCDTVEGVKVRWRCRNPKMRHIPDTMTERTAEECGRSAAQGPEHGQIHPPRPWLATVVRDTIAMRGGR